jgi:YbgC/YbaW family acyl-CoA thioester hydrolase
MSRSLSWSPTVAMSWLWGLGFFYSLHVTLTHGLVGFLAFALPNALGLYLFGHVLGRHRDPGALFDAVSARYGGFMLAYQVAAVAITLFGFGAFLAVPLLGEAAAVPAMVVLALASCAVGHVLRPAALASLHAGYALVGVGAALAACAGLAMGTPPSAMPGLDSVDARLVGLALPSLAGFLLGPWLDVQQWQRAVEVRRAGGDPRVAYAGGALLFLALLCVNAAIAIASGPATGRAAVDGIVGFEGSVAQAAMEAGPYVAAAFAVWCILAMSSTVDSFQSATRWFLTGVSTRSANPLMAFVPKGLMASPLPVAAAALAAAAWAVSSDLALIHLMAPFATVFAAASACLACEALGGRPRLDPTLCLLTGALSVAAFFPGYVLASPPLLWASTLIALAPAVAPLLALRGAVPEAQADVPAAPIAAAVPAVVANDATPASVPGGHGSTGHTIEDNWFCIRLVSTYDDTNSVGNVYFANYFRWVGKAREMFFAHSMPEFDLRNTDFLILTKRFVHDFRCETSEFDHVTVRVRVASYNRKFVVMEHEITSERHGLLGRGQQELMFVNSKGKPRPIDIPGDVMRAFLPFMEAARKPRAA